MRKLGLGLLFLLAGIIGAAAQISQSGVTQSGAVTNGNCVQWAATLQISDAGAACGTGTFHPGYVASRWYYPPFPSGSFSSISSPNTGRLYALPYYVPFAHTFTGIGFYANSSSAASNVELGIYKNSGGAPGALVEDAGEVAVPQTTAGAYSITGLSIPLSAGWYWIAYSTDTTGSPSILGGNSGSQYNAYFQGAATLTNSPATNAVSFVYGSWAFSTGALPDPFPSTTLVTGSTTAMVALLG